MKNQLPGNPYDNMQYLDSNDAYEVSSALRALAFEQRTANLIAGVQILAHGRPHVDSAVTREIRRRMGYPTGEEADQ